MTFIFYSGRGNFLPKIHIRSIQIVSQYQMYRNQPLKVSIQNLQPLHHLISARSKQLVCVNVNVEDKHRNAHTNTDTMRTSSARHVCDCRRAPLVGLCAPFCATQSTTACGDALFAALRVPFAPAVAVPYRFCVALAVPETTYRRLAVVDLLLIALSASGWADARYNTQNAWAEWGTMRAAMFAWDIAERELIV